LGKSTTAKTLAAQTLRVSPVAEDVSRGFATLGRADQPLDQKLTRYGHTQRGTLQTKIRARKRHPGIESGRKESASWSKDEILN